MNGVDPILKVLSIAYQHLLYESGYANDNLAFFRIHSEKTRIKSEVIESIFFALSIKHLNTSLLDQPRNVLCSKR